MIPYVVSLLFLLTSQSHFVVGVDLLIHFRDYVATEDTRNLLEHALHFCPNCRYHVHPKSKTLKGTFTDFGVVSTETPQATKESLQKHPFVRAITEERRVYHRALKEEDPLSTHAPPPFQRKLKQHSSYSVDPAKRLGIPKLWEKVQGSKVRVGIFDTGIVRHHVHFSHNNVDSCINFTDNPSCEDGHGHGTFVAGVIASSQDCVGITPEARLHIFKVFTNSQISFTSWFLDAFNNALQSQLDVINFSIGGPDYMDQPFMDKVREISASGIMVVSAIGNDGPLWGTLTNPADQMDVIGVGAMTPSMSLSSFSSRGMTTHELPYGYGRVKPDVVTFGEFLRGTNALGGCKLLSGTSVASPVVAGSVALLASYAKKLGVKVNPGMLKQIVTESAKLLPEEKNHYSMYEQGQGLTDVAAAMNIVETFKPHLSSLPPVIDFTQKHYQWPHSTSPLYFTEQPHMINLTLLSSADVTTYINKVNYFAEIPAQQHVLDVQLEHAGTIWPWSGYLAVRIRVNSASFRGVHAGYINLEASTAAGGILYTLRIPVKVNVAETPPRERRILWDQYHQLHYPPAYVPRDDHDSQEVIDTAGDHPHTNFKGVFTFLTGPAQYFVELLATDLTTFNASLYGAVLLVDTEEEFFMQEVTKIQDDVSNKGLGLIVVAEWFNRELMKMLKFVDDHTQEPLTPVTGGANVPALNDLLKPFGISFGEKVYRGEVSFTERRTQTLFKSGTSIVAFPSGGTLYFNTGGLLDMEGHKIHNTNNWVPHVPVLGLTQAGQGRVAVYGDSGCWDLWHNDVICHDLIEGIVAFATSGGLDQGMMLKGATGKRTLQSAFRASNDVEPQRADPDLLLQYSPIARASRDIHRVDRIRIGYPSPTLPPRSNLSSSRPPERTRPPLPPVLTGFIIDHTRPLQTPPPSRLGLGYSSWPLPVIGVVLVVVVLCLRKKRGLRSLRGAQRLRGTLLNVNA